MNAVAVEARRPRKSALAAAWAFAKHHALTVYSLLFFAYLLLPIVIVIAFSFNNPTGRFNYVWQGFTLNNWRYWDGVPGIRSAIFLSLEIGVIASVIATSLGVSEIHKQSTCQARRHTHPGRSAATDRAAIAC